MRASTGASRRSASTRRASTTSPSGARATEPGVWYGTDTGGHWTLERLTTSAARRAGRAGGRPGRDARRSRTAESFAADGDAAARIRAVRVITGKPGAWTTTRIADDTGDASPSIARDSAGPPARRVRQRRLAGLDRLAYATNASGAWVVAPRRPARSATVGPQPIDRASTRRQGPRRVRAVDRRAPSPVRHRLDRLRDERGRARGPCRRSPRRPGVPLRPLDRRSTRRASAGRLLAGQRRRHARQSRAGVRVATLQRGDLVDRDAEQLVARRPAVARHRRRRAPATSCTRATAPYSICAVPLCSSAPGLRYWSTRRASAPPDG